MEKIIDEEKQGEALILDTNKKNNNQKDFFIDIHQKQFNVLRLRLTDSKNRLVGRNPYWYPENGPHPNSAARAS